MRLLSTIVLALIPTAFASPSQEEQLEFQQVLGQLAEFGESLFTAPPPRDGPSICWNGFARGDGSAPSSVPAVASTECMEGTELFGDRCYVPCHNGYKAWGPFCLATSNSAPVRTYQRGNGKLLADQSTVATINNADFVVGNCPASLPHQCAIACTKNAAVCVTEGAVLSQAALKIVQLAQKGEYGKAALEAKKIYDKVSSWPKCSTLSA